MAPAFLSASDCRSSAAAVAVVAGGAFQFHKRGGIHFIVLLIALLIVASFVVSLRASARIVVGLSSSFVRRGLNKFFFCYSYYYAQVGGKLDHGSNYRRKKNDSVVLFIGST